jgi:hypothetical protein
MSVIDHLDTATKRIYLAVGVRAYHPVDDIYEEIRTLRRTNEALRWFKVPVTAAGRVSKGGGRFTPRYAVFREGWRVVPEDTSHTLFISGEQLTAEGGAGPDCMDLSLLSASSKVFVQYEPPAAEVIEVATGAGPTVADIVNGVMDESMAGHILPGSFGLRTALLEKVHRNRLEEAPGNPGTLVLYDDDDLTPLLTWTLRDELGGAVASSPGAPSRRTKAT